MPGLDADRLSVLIEQLYDTVVEPDGWTRTMVGFRDALNAEYVHVGFIPTASNTNHFYAQSPWDEAKMQGSAAFGLDDIPGFPAFLAGDIDVPSATFSHLSEDEFRQTDFYRGWVGPVGLREACHLKFVHTPDHMGILHFTTGQSRAPISKDEQRFLAMLSPHLRRAMMIGDLLDHARIAAQAYREALYGLNVPVVLAASDGGVVYANATAEAMLSGKGPITTVKGKLQARSQMATWGLRDAIARASKSGEDLGRRGIGIPLSLPGETPALAYVLPLTTGSVRNALGPAGAAVFISTAASSAPLPEAILVTLFDLTPAEARVMATIGSGQNSGATAKTLGITENTLKTHLNRIYMKTDTSRQADLVKLVADIATPVIAVTPAGAGLNA